MKNCVLCGYAYGSRECESAHSPGQTMTVARRDHDELRDTPPIRSAIDDFHELPWPEIVADAARDTPPLNGKSPFGVIIDEDFKVTQLGNGDFNVGRYSHSATVNTEVFDEHRIGMVKNIQIGNIALAFGRGCILCNGECKGHQL